MQRPSLFCLLITGCLPLFVGCWGESKGSLAKKLQEQRALMESNEPDPDSGVASPPKVAAAGTKAGGPSVAGTKAGGQSPDPDGGTAPLPKTEAAAVPAVSKPSQASPVAQGNAAFTLPVVPNPAPSTPLGATATVEQRRGRTIENLTKLGKALNAYSDGLGDFPGRLAGYPATRTLDPPGYPRMSWRVAILPRLGYEKLFKQYQPDEPWDSASNKLVLAQIPPEFQSPERRDNKTNYLVPLASFAAFGGAGRLHRSTFEDPQDSTVILVEADDSQAVEWTRPDDLLVEVAPNISLRSQLGSLRGDGFFAVLANGRVCRIKSQVNDLSLKALFTIDGGDSHQIKDAIQEATAVPASSPAVPQVASVPTPIAPPSEGKVGPAPAESVAGKAPAPTLPGEPVSVPSPLKTPAGLVKKKLPVPSESELVFARTTLKKLYAEEYKKAKTAEERRQLAGKLAGTSSEAGEDLAVVHELLRMSRDLYAQEGDLAGALRTVSQLEQRLEIDAPAMRLETLTLFLKSPDAQSKHTEVLTEAKKLLADAIEADKYDVALDALKIGKGAAKRGDDSKFLSKAGKKQTWLESARRAYSEFSKAKARLAAGPDDPQTNQILGTYTCLVKSRWELGLPQLARATDLKVRFLAKLDLSPSKSPQETFDLANQYWDLAEQKPDMELEEQGLKMRAAYWYAQAAKELPDGLDKIKARKRLAEIVEAYGKEETERATGRGDISAIAGVKTNNE